MSSFIQSLTTFGYDYLSVALWAGGIIFFLVLIVFFLKPKKDFSKAFFLILISTVSIIATTYIVLGTLDLIKKSPTKGPVHWHADFKIFRCGEEIELVNPKGLSNRVGTPLVHEHEDKRVHIEGIPEDSGAASLKNFIHAVGGYLNEDALRIPTNTGSVEMKNGNMCGRENGILQVFVWTTDTAWIATQQKIELVSDYVISPHTLVPPGDCVIFEFDASKGRTEHICEQYTIAETRGDLIINRGIIVTP